MRRALVIGAVVSTAGLAVACASLIGADFGADTLAVCSPALPPPRPDAGNAGASPGFTAAINAIDWGDGNNDAGQPKAYSIGYDLDGRCTSLFDSPACVPAKWTGNTVVDGTNGIDNSTGLMLHDEMRFLGFALFNSGFFTGDIMGGSEAPPAIFRVSDYSGLGYDEQVTVEWLVPAAAKGDAGAPDWNASPTFPISGGTADAVDGGAGVVSHFIDRQAYVSAFQLVAHFQGAPIGISNVPITTTDSLVTADLVLPPGGRRFVITNGVVAGHLRVSTLFDDLALLSKTTALGAAVTVCRNTSLAYPDLKRWICSYTDTRIDAGPGQACDGLSFGAAFVASPAEVGPLSPPPPVPSSLCPMGEDPKGDNCATAP